MYATTSTISSEGCNEELTNLDIIEDEHVPACKYNQSAEKRAFSCHDVPRRACAGDLEQSTSRFAGASCRWE
jgi:hypothetical protein